MVRGPIYFLLGRFELSKIAFNDLYSAVLKLNYITQMRVILWEVLAYVCQRVVLPQNSFYLVSVYISLLLQVLNQQNFLELGLVFQIYLVYTISIDIIQNFH